MKQEDKIENEIRKTLSSFDEIANIQAKPYFYTRLMAKIEHSRPVASIAWKWSIAATAFIILVNLFTLLTLSGEADVNYSAMEELSAEYTISALDIYDITLEE